MCHFANKVLSQIFRTKQAFTPSIMLDHHDVDGCDSGYENFAILITIGDAYRAVYIK